MSQHVGKWVEVVGGYGGVRELASFDADIFVSGFWERGSEIEIFNIDREPFLAFRFCGLQQNFNDNDVQAGVLGGDIIRYKSKFPPAVPLTRNFNDPSSLSFVLPQGCSARRRRGDFRESGRMQAIGDYGGGKNAANDFFCFNNQPLCATWTGFRR
jgi:hypothetical protein